MRSHITIALVFLLALAETDAFAQETAIRLLALSPGVRRTSPARITYVVEKPVQEVAIEIVDEYGRVAMRFSSLPSEIPAPGPGGLALTPGEHTVTWDLHHACGTAFAGLDSLADIEDMQPLVAPGTFEVRLTTDADRVTRPLVVTPDPRIAATQADLEAQLKLALEMCSRRLTALSAVARIQKAEESLNGWIASADGERTRAADEQMLRSLTEFRMAIAGPRGVPASGRRPSWAARLAALQRQVVALDRRPTETEYAAYRALDAELEQLLRNQPSLDAPASIQFDSKGADFGAWLRAFIAAVRSHWTVPPGFSGDRGRVAVSFYVNRSGVIDEVTIEQPSRIAAFNDAARRAILDAGPAAPLPKRYPDDRCFFTITFFYNLAPRQ